MSLCFLLSFSQKILKKGERIRFSRGRKCSLKQMKSLISVSVKLDDFAFLLQNDVKKGRKKLKKVSPSTSSGWVVPFVLEKWKLTSLQKPSSRKLFLLGTFWGALIWYANGNLKTDFKRFGFCEFVLTEM